MLRVDARFDRPRTVGAMNELAESIRPDPSPIGRGFCTFALAIDVFATDSSLSLRIPISPLPIPLFRVRESFFVASAN